MICKEEKKAALEKILSSGGFEYAFHCTDNITDPILIIKNYNQKSKPSLPVSFGFSLEEFYNGNGGGLGRKCWITSRNLQLIDNDGPKDKDGPQYHAKYKEFEYEDTTYYPFSVDFTGYNLKNLQSIQSVCQRLFNHIVFDNNA